MTKQSHLDLEKAVADPESQFHFPQDILSCSELTSARKVEALRNWKCLLEERSTAAGEGMTEHKPGALVRDAETLEQVGKALACLDAAST